MMLAMPFVEWNAVRDALEWLLAQPNSPTQEQIAKEAGLNASTLSTFRAVPDRGMQKRTWAKLAPVLNKHLPPDRRFNLERTGQQNQEPIQLSGSARPSGAPVVDVRRFPVEAEGPEMLKRIRASAQLWRSSSSDDPDVFGILTTDPIWGEFWAGDVLLFSPATEPLEGDYILARVGNKVQVCKWFPGEATETPFVRVPAGREYTEFKRLGTLVDQWRSHLNRRTQPSRQPSLN